MRLEAYIQWLSSEDKEAMREFWRFYEPRIAGMTARLRAAAARSPAWSQPSSSAALAEVTRQDEHAVALQRRAVLDDDWDAWLARLAEHGTRYAEAGIGYGAWFELIRGVRAGVQHALRELAAREPRTELSSVLLISRGMNHLLDITAGCIGDAYVAATQRLVARSDARYSAMFQRSPLPMWIFDRDTLRFVAVNDAAIRHYGYSRDQFLTMTLADIRPARDLGALREDVARAHGRAESRTWQHRKQDGSIISVEVRANDFDLDGRNVRLVLITDVTEREQTARALRKAQEQLFHAQKMEALGRLAGGISHDFNNVLTVVQSYASLLEDSIAETDPRHEDAAEIRRASERGHAITQQLLTLSRQGVATPQSIDLDEVVAGLAPMLRHLLGDAVRLVIHRGPGEKVLADRGHMEQVLMNLAANARDAMPAGGRLTIEGRALDLDAEAAAARRLNAGRYVELAVTDTGTGIAPETQARIFDPFFTTKEAGKGTGLGLSIVHGIVSQAGGAISVYSEPGLGTTFRIQLPVTDLDATAAAPPVLVAPRTLPPLRVLVVDDQADVRAVAVRILAEAGCTVIEAASGDEARRICTRDEEPIDLVVLDVVLPDVRGDVLAAQLRELRPRLNVLRMSGYPAGALSPSGALADGLLAKPFSPTEMRAAVARACGEPGRRAPASAPVRELRRVLIADDDDAVRKLLVQLVRAAGFETVDVASGGAAAAALERMPFDVVVSDVHMPGGGGLELLRAVRREDLDVPVILLTGDPSLSAVTEALEHGAFRYVTKPFDHDAFTKLVERAARVNALARLRREAVDVSGLHAGAADRAGREVRLAQALDGMWLAFQPIVHARSGVVYGVEALLRTTEPSLATPAAFLDAARQLGRLAAVGRTVRSMAARVVGERRELALFVNLHPEDLHDLDLIDAMAPLSRIASRVILEVTERASLERSLELTTRVARLRQAGFRLAVDDIGAGYSGLTSFTELTPEFVKLDMSLVRDVHTSAVKQRTIAALCRLCHEVGALVVGEGVETLEERHVLIDLGCDLLQGYLLGRPNRVLPP